MLEAEPSLQLLSLALASLDAITSLGTIAREMDFVRPEIVEDSMILIQGGRHLLQELTVEGTFHTSVPIDMM